MKDESEFDAKPFCHPAPEGQYVLGDVWDIFEGGSAVLSSLPAMMKQMRQMTGFRGGSYGESGTAHIRGNRDSIASIGCFPGGPSGLSFVFAAESGEMPALRSVYPHTGCGVDHQMMIRRVMPWHSRVEAYIEASFLVDEDARVTFFDARYALDYRHYRSYLPFQFVLYGFALRFGRADTAPLRIENPPYLEAFQREGLIDPGKNFYDIPMQGGSALMPALGGEPNMVYFRGTVNRVTQEDIPLGYESWWSLRVTVLRLRKNIEIGVVLTQTILGDKAVPQAGEEIDGVLWLAGHLSNY